MTQTPVAATRSLAALVDELVVYLRDQHKLQETTHPHPSAPEGLERVFDSFSCKTRALAAGLEMTPDEDDALEHYLRHFLSTLKQLIPALDQLKYDTKADIAGLISASHALVEADGTVRLQEVAYLASLQDALLAL